MVKTEEAAHGRRVEKRRVEGAGVGPAQDVHSAVPWSGERGGGVVLVPPCGCGARGRGGKYDRVQVCCTSNCPC
jgi:hypothetical protein